MSELKVEIVEIASLLPHPNADRLSLAQIKGWQCVVQKDIHKAGDKVVYIPIDSLLPEALEARIFGADSKIKLHNHRVRTIKLRGAISQGLVITLEMAGIKSAKVGTDLTEQLGITKYEPPVKSSPQGQGKAVSWKQINPNFRKYTSIENFKNYNQLFKPEDLVIATEKIHGTNFRAGWVPYHAGTWWRKALKWLRLTPQWEFVYGSHNVQLQSKTYSGYYKKDAGNVYGEIVEKYQLKKRLRYGEVIYGEIYGCGIQKGYVYGCTEKERKLVVFDLLYDGMAYVSHTELRSFCIDRKLDMAPVLYCGKFDEPQLKELTKGPSVLAPSQEVREGIVVRSYHEQQCYMGRKILKMINDDYLLKEDNTDFH